MRIVRATVEDAAAIAALSIRTERETYESTTPSLLAHVSDIQGRIQICNTALNEFQHVVSHFLVRDSTGRPVGFLTGSFFDTAQGARLNAVYLLRSHQRRGFGRRLFATFAEDVCSRGVRDIVAAVPEDNVGAREFLAWCGGIEVSREERACGNGSVHMVNLEWRDARQLASYFRMLV